MPRDIASVKAVRGPQSLPARIVPSCASRRAMRLGSRRGREEEEEDLGKNVITIYE
jgi:hypothetical protein